MMSKAINQIIRFGLVGILNTAIGLSAIYAVMYFTDLNPLTANVIGYGIGMTVGFILNRIWTFGDSKSSLEVLPRYILALLISYLANLFFVFFAITFFNIEPYIAQIFGISIYTTLMFLGCRLFVFRQRNPIRFFGKVG